MTAVSFLALTLLEARQIHPAGHAKVAVTVGVRVLAVDLPMHAMAPFLLLVDKIGANCQWRIGRCTLFWAGDIPILVGCGGDAAGPMQRRPRGNARPAWPAPPRYDDPPSWVRGTTAQQSWR